MKLIDKINNKIAWFFTNGNKRAYEAKSNTSNEDMKTVNHALQRAKEQNLETEMVTFALRIMKDNPKLSVGEAITIAYFHCVN